MKGIRNTLTGFLAAALFILIAGCGSSSSSSSGSFNDGPIDQGDNNTGIKSTASSPAEMGVGDIMAFDLNGDELIIDFGGTDSNADFILITGTNGINFGSSFTISADFVDPDEVVGDALKADAQVPALSDESDAGDILSAWLRESEREIALTEPAPDPYQSKAVSAAKSLGVGSVRTFKVLKSVQGGNSYVFVNATAKCVGGNIAIFVDTRVGEGTLSYAEVDDVCDELDDIADEVQDLVGDASDVNDDGLVSVLITPQVNLIGGSMGGIIVGYFYGADLYPSSGSNTVSNHQEIVYLIAPDPGGKYGTPISKQYFMEGLLPGVFAHELQHAVSYNQHVFVNDSTAEEIWLNEGMSHLIEGIVGYGNENPARYARFLANPALTSLVKSSSLSLRERGASYLFLRYLYEQAEDGDAFIRSLVSTGNVGVNNVIAAFNGSDPDFNDFAELFAHWSLALAVSGSGLSNDRKFNYEDRVVHGLSNNWTGVILNGAAENGRGTMLSGVNLSKLSIYQDEELVSTSASYHEVDVLPSSVTLNASGIDEYAVLIRSE